VSSFERQSVIALQRPVRAITLDLDDTLWPCELSGAPEEVVHLGDDIELDVRNDDHAGLRMASR
jgi:hypothetical protein